MELEGRALQAGGAAQALGPLRDSLQENPLPLPANTFYKMPPTPPSETIYSWCCAGASPWQQDNAGGRASRLVPLVVLWGPHGRQSGCASQCHLLCAGTPGPPSLSSFLTGLHPDPGLGPWHPGRGAQKLGQQILSTGWEEQKTQVHPSTEARGRLAPPVLCGEIHPGAPKPPAGWAVPT